MKRNRLGQFIKGENPWNKGTHIQTNTGRTHFKSNGSMAEENNSQWKGKKAGYVAVHKWVERHKGKPTKCKMCKRKLDNRRLIQWANISGEYKRDLDDYMALCIWCHRDYDDWYKKMAVRFLERSVK